MAQLVGASTHIPKGCGFNPGSILGTYLNCGVDPHLGSIWEAVDQCFSLFLSPSFPKINKNREREETLALPHQRWRGKRRMRRGCRGAETGGLLSLNCLIKKAAPSIPTMLSVVVPVKREKSIFINHSSTFLYFAPFPFKKNVPLEKSQT